jgi:hypothetical protein
LAKKFTFANGKMFSRFYFCHIRRNGFGQMILVQLNKMRSMFYLLDNPNTKKPKTIMLSFQKQQSYFSQID